MKLLIIQSVPTVFAPSSKYKYLSQQSIFKHTQSVFLHQYGRKAIVSYILTAIYLQIEEEVETFRTEMRDYSKFSIIFLSTV
jgi:hypothetical protein